MRARVDPLADGLALLRLDGAGAASPIEWHATAAAPPPPPALATHCSPRFRAASGAAASTSAAAAVAAAGAPPVRRRGDMRGGASLFLKVRRERAWCAQAGRCLGAPAANSPAAQARSW